MDYQIALAPDLALSSTDFVADWNATAEAHAVAHAHLVPSKGASYDPALMDTAITVLSSIGIGITTNALYDLLKLVIAKKKGQHVHTRITKVDQPDGTHILVVDVEEK